MNKAIKVHNTDNVIVSTVDLVKGQLLLPYNITLQDDIKANHKVSLDFIKLGSAVKKYGFTIGIATQDIQAGEWVHSHNLKTELSDNLTYTFTSAKRIATICEATGGADTFIGYLRENGKVGIRNELWIINTVGCVNKTAESIANESEALIGTGCDGIKYFPHPFGCSQLGDDLNDTKRILAAIASHPNAGAVLIIGLGCENNQLSDLLLQVDKPAHRVRYFNAQEVGHEINAGLIHVQALLNELQKDVRESVPISELVLGMKCGGSDALSGITANPIVGKVADKMTAKEGAVVLTETPEMFGAEQILMNRASTKSVFDDLVELVNNFKQYFRKNNQPIYENPSPGNKAGGLTTLEEKSLGAIQKGGQAIVNDVIRYGHGISRKGMTILESPGNDAVSATALAASGVHIILFTTGRGTPLGFPVPTLKIASNSALFANKPHWIDFNAGALVDSDANIDELASELFSLCISIANGKHSKNEINKNHEIAIWKRGVTL